LAKKILIIVPAFNEEKSLGTVLDSIKNEAPYADIVVINDGSHDATADVARKNGVAVISVPYNLGIGGAVQTGLIYAQRQGYDVAIQLDADGQHKAEELEKLLHHIKNDEADLVL